MLINWEQAHCIAQDRGKMGVEFFSKMLELGYEKFPHNTTDLTQSADIVFSLRGTDISVYGSNKSDAPAYTTIKSNTAISIPYQSLVDICIWTQI